MSVNVCKLYKILIFSTRMCYLLYRLIVNHLHTYVYKSNASTCIDLNMFSIINTFYLIMINVTFPVYNMYCILIWTDGLYSGARTGIYAE